TLLGAVAIASAAVAVPGSIPLAASENAPGDTPIMRLFNECRTVRAALRAYVHTGDPETADETMETLFYHRLDAIEAEMMALPSTCAADVAAKMLVAMSDGDCSVDPDDPVWVEARELTGGLV